MSLEEIEGIKADMKKLEDTKEIDIREGLNCIQKIKRTYDALIKKKGTAYCTKYCSDISIRINKMLSVLIEYES